MKLIDQRANPNDERRGGREWSNMLLVISSSWWVMDGTGVGGGEMGGVVN